MGGPAVPSAMAKMFTDGAQQAAAAPAALGAYKPPRMSKPTAEVFRNMEARKKQVKMRQKRQISVKTFKSFDQAQGNLLHGAQSPFGGELMTLLQVCFPLFSRCKNPLCQIVEVRAIPW